jgi:hypothetical protein
MADWYGTSRSNYVAIIPEMLPIFEELFDIQAHQNQDDKWCLISTTFHGGTPDAYCDEDNEAFFVDHDLPEVIGMLDVIHLLLKDEPNNVFVWVESGAEKSRYVTGFSMAIAPDGTVLDRISIDDIYEDQPDWTRAEY